MEQAKPVHVNLKALYQAPTIHHSGKLMEPVHLASQTYVSPRNARPPENALGNVKSRENVMEAVP